MNRENHESANFFFGKEVEHTPAYNKNTLFVVGFQAAADIDYHVCLHPAGIDHVYFGANQSFPKTPADSDWSKWTVMVRYFLSKGLWCTLDIDVDHVEGLLDTGLTEHPQFIPMISVKLPYISLLGYNATVKLDDIDFAKTNPGVWCHQLHNLLDRSKFTDWTQYTKDQVLK